MADVHAQMHEALAEMELTREQLQSIHKTLTSRKAEIVAAFEPLEDAHAELHHLMLAEMTDANAIRVAAADVGTALGDAAVLLAEVKAEIVKKAALSPDQQRKLAGITPGPVIHAIIEAHHQHVLEAEEAPSHP